ncbi:unnamed protein product [Effrenium voratum]|nr:unnamed protein product [Effrenium voratum]
MATAAAFFVLLALPVAAHSPLGSNGERFRGNSRKLWDLAAQENHIWGRCDEWDAKVSGCHLNSQNKCSDRLSAGPATYDLEITLGNLTPSTAEREVHLAWWAPRKSQTNWNPVENLQGCAVYRSMRSAYPDFNDPDFNGGNLKVSESGEVVIRMQSPATYFVTSWISVPHIHLRLCSNDTFAHTTQDAIVFAKNGAELVAGEAGSTLQIRNIQNFSYWPNPGSGNVSDRNIVGFLVWKKQQDGSVTTTASPGQLVEEIIDDEMANFNWDALEFSPIYQCFTSQQLFDHFTATCVDQCSDSAEVARGQCVRRGNKPEVQAVATWDLAVTCNEACWAEWKNKTLHYTRLAVADLLDIPFQEVEKAAIAFGASGGRRLSTEREATVQVLIKTKRLSITEINTLTPLLFANTATATEIMNFPVSSVIGPDMGV